MAHGCSHYHALAPDDLQDLEGLAEAYTAPGDSFENESYHQPAEWLMGEGGGGAQRGKGVEVECELGHYLHSTQRASDCPQSIALGVFFSQPGFMNLALAKCGKCVTFLAFSADLAQILATLLLIYGLSLARNRGRFDESGPPGDELAGLWSRGRQFVFKSALFGASGRFQARFTECCLVAGAVYDTVGKFLFAQYQASFNLYSRS